MSMLTASSTGMFEVVPHKTKETACLLGSATLPQCCQPISTRRAPGDKKSSIKNV